MNIVRFINKSFFDRCVELQIHSLHNIFGVSNAQTLFTSLFATRLCKSVLSVKENSINNLLNNNGNNFNFLDLSRFSHTF